MSGILTVSKLLLTSNSVHILWRCELQLLLLRQLQASTIIWIGSCKNRLKMPYNACLLFRKVAFETVKFFHFRYGNPMLNAFKLHFNTSRKCSFGHSVSWGALGSWCLLGHRNLSLARLRYWAHGSSRTVVR